MHIPFKPSAVILCQQSIYAIVDTFINNSSADLSPSLKMHVLLQLLSCPKVQYEVCVHISYIIIGYWICTGKYWVTRLPT